MGHTQNAVPVVNFRTGCAQAPRLLPAGLYEKRTSEANKILRVCLRAYQIDRTYVCTSYRDGVDAHAHTPSRGSAHDNRSEPDLERPPARWLTR